MYAECLCGGADKRGFGELSQVMSSCTSDGGKDGTGQTSVRKACAVCTAVWALYRTGRQDKRGVCDSRLMLLVQIAAPMRQHS